MRVGSGGGVKSVGVKGRAVPCPPPPPPMGILYSTLPSFVSRDQDGSPSNSIIVTYDLTEN